MSSIPAVVARKINNVYLHMYCTYVGIYIPITYIVRNPNFYEYINRYYTT